MEKNMKAILLAAAALVLIGVGQASATFYTTVRSTSVQISSAAAYTDGMEFLSIMHGTADVKGDSFIVVVDSYALEAQGALGQALEGGTTLQGVLYGRARYPQEQYIIPPIVISTNTAVGGGFPLQRYDFRDSNGCGIPVTDGLLVLQPGVNYGTVVTVEWRPRPINGPCKTQ